MVSKKIRVFLAKIFLSLSWKKNFSTNPFLIKKRCFFIFIAQNKNMGRRDFVPPIFKKKLRNKKLKNGSWNFIKKRTAFLLKLPAAAFFFFLFLAAAFFLLLPFLIKKRLSFFLKISEATKKLFYRLRLFFKYGQQALIYKLIRAVVILLKKATG